MNDRQRRGLASTRSAAWAVGQAGSRQWFAIMLALGCLVWTPSVLRAADLKETCGMSEPRTLCGEHSDSEHRSLPAERHLSGRPAELTKSKREATSMKPVIGINAGITPNTGASPTISLKASYVDAVTSAGGLAIVLAPVEDLDLVRLHADLCDGFVFVGGGDLDPARFGEEPHPSLNPTHPRRESYDFALIEAVVASRKPFLAICLGCQQLNVALGGTLIQDIDSETSSLVRHTGNATGHDVEVVKGTRLHELAGLECLSANSSHHQALKAVAERLRISARTADGIVEACELRDYPFGLAVQWHPERLGSEKPHMRLFEELVTESGWRRP